LPRIAKNKFGWVTEQEEVALPPSLAPSQFSWSSCCPCYHDTCTHVHNSAIQETTCMHWHTGTYRHAHMHKLTRALECATASACQLVYVHTHACTTHTQTRVYAHARAYGHVYLHTRASAGLNSPPNDGDMVKISERVLVLLLSFMNSGFWGENSKVR